MSNDISTMYTKDQNKKSGRTGWVGWKAEKETVISPSAYGEYISQRPRRNKHRRNKK